MRISVVPLGGFEPPTLPGYAPKAYAYAYSATEALVLNIIARQGWFA